MSQTLPAGQNRALPKGRSRFFAGAYRDDQDRLRFRFQADKMNVGGAILTKPYYDFIKEMRLDRILQRDIYPRRLAEKAIRMLRTRSPLPGMTLKGIQHG
jgi:hypothetical protein